MLSFNAWRLPIALSLITLGGPLGTSQVVAQELRIPVDARLRNLGSLYIADTVANVAYICAERVPETREEWGKAVATWKGTNRNAIAELEKLRSEIDVALRTNVAATSDLDTWAYIINSHVEMTAFVGITLSSLSDKQAVSYCESTREGWRRPMPESDLKEARVAAAAALEDISRHR